jgi:colanic acid biosynthesis glycosyl transferase WcaI
MPPMRLLVICPHYEPDVAPTGVVMTAICGELIAAGHELQIVTALPWYEKHRVEPQWAGRLVRNEEHPWGRVSRVHPFPTSKGSIPARSVGFAGFTGLVTLVALFRRPRPDGVLAMSPPITLGLAGALVARIRRAPFVFNIQDVFPDVAIEVNAIRSPRLIRVARALERFTYRRSDAVTVLSEDLRDNVVAKIGAGSRTRVRVIPNFVDTSAISPGTHDNSYRAEFGLRDRIVVMYAGNVGFSQPLELMIDAARELQHRQDVVFVINGGGSGRRAVEAAAEGLGNVRFVDFQPRERLPEVLAAADIHVIALRRGLARASVPSKLYSILAAGRPVLASIDAGTEVARVIDVSGSGWAVPPEDGPAFTAALVELVDDAAERESMGRNGRSFVESWISPAGVAQSYADLFADLRT